MTVYEHQSIYCDAEVFTERHLESLAQFNAKQGGRYFTLLHKGIRFGSYVGVLQVGDLQIEILPKIDRLPEGRPLQSLLIEMLQQCQLLRPESPSKAHLQTKPQPLLLLYLDTFIDAVEQLLQQGLLRRYVMTKGALPYWKGQVQLDKQLLLQASKPHFCYSRHTDYDYQHIWHQILYQALQLLAQYPLSGHRQARVHALLLRFPAQTALQIHPNTFENLVYDRQTEPYRQAIEIASLLLRHNSPQIKAGTLPVLSLLFDMNRLFEEYIYRQLLAACSGDWTLERQAQRGFWEHKTLRPDLLLRHPQRSLVMDTKWKMLFQANPEDADLRQIYAYQQQFGASEGWLIFPALDGLAKTYLGKFEQNQYLAPSAVQHCRLVWVELVDAEGQLNKNIGKTLFDLATGAATELDYGVT